MKTYKYPDKKSWSEIIQRPVMNSLSLEKKVKKIIEKVMINGDKAIRKYTKKFDGVKLENLLVSEIEMAQAANLLSEDLKKAILQAKRNIETFHASQLEEVKKVETMPGVFCWRRSTPIEKVGLYIPGGSAPLFSTVLMLAVPARLAGCREIVLTSPPLAEGGSIHPAILYTARLCGVTKIFKAGGVQAIAGMAFGTESIPRVFKIFGPGNQYVTKAKELLQRQGIAIDMPAGPSEILVIADETATPEFVAADLLSQAEHGPDSQVLLVTCSLPLVDRVKKEIRKQSAQLTRKEIARRALQNSKVVLLNNMEEAIEFSNCYAPEHLVISCIDAEKISEQITSAGSVFIGNYSPESAGDYASGTNHTLPTNGYSAMYSGVSLDSFFKKITFQELTKEGLQNISDTVMIMAEAEGLDAHKNAVAIRLKK